MPLLVHPRSAATSAGSTTATVAGLRRAAARAVTLQRLAAGRAGAGGVMLARPRLLPALLGVDSATSSRMGWAVQLLGARELALGVGTWVALRRPDSGPARLWVAAGALSDALDAVVLAGAVGRGRISGPRGTALVALASTATAWQAGALAES